MRHLADVVESPRNKSQHKKTTGNPMTTVHTGSAVMADRHLIVTAAQS